MIIKFKIFEQVRALRRWLRAAPGQNYSDEVYGMLLSYNYLKRIRKYETEPIANIDLILNFLKNHKIRYETYAFKDGDAFLIALLNSEDLPKNYNGKYMVPDNIDMNSYLINPKYFFKVYIDNIEDLNSVVMSIKYNL